MKHTILPLTGLLPALPTKLQAADPSAAVLTEQIEDTVRNSSL